MNWSTKKTCPDIKTAISNTIKLQYNLFCLTIYSTIQYLDFIHINHTEVCILIHAYSYIKTVAMSEMLAFTQNNYSTWKLGKDMSLTVHNTEPKHSVVMAN